MQQDKMVNMPLMQQHSDAAAVSGTTTIGTPSASHTCDSTHNGQCALISATL
jgi:hypothetical protein